MDDKTAVRQYTEEQEPSDVPAIIATPLRLSGDLLAKGSGYMKFMAPQLITLAVCLFLIPLVIFLSAFAGWFVWKHVAVGWETPVYLQYGDGLPPYAEISLPSLVASQPYDISLHLTIPASESNFALGNFMAKLTLSTPSNRTLASIRRPALVLPVRGSMWASSPSILDLVVPLLSSYTPGTSRVVAKLELGRADGWKSLGEGHGRELSVLSASLRGAIRLEGLRGLVTRFPLISAAISSTIFLSLSLLVLVAFLLPAMTRSTSQFEVAGPPPPEKAREQKVRAAPSDGSDEYEKPWTSRRRSRRGTESSGPYDSDIKTTVSSTIIPESSTGSRSPLRRRRSRLSQNLSDDDA